MQNTKSQTVTAQDSRISINNIIYSNAIKCQLHEKAGLILNWGREGVSIIPFTSFMVTNVVANSFENQMSEGTWYSVEGNNLGGYHKSIDPRESPYFVKITKAKINIKYFRAGIKLALIGENKDADFEISLSMYLPSNELYNLLNLVNDIFIKQLEKYGNA